MRVIHKGVHEKKKYFTKWPYILIAHSSKVVSCITNQKYWNQMAGFFLIKLKAKYDNGLEDKHSFEKCWNLFEILDFWANYSSVALVMMC